MLNNILFDNTRTNSWGEQLSVGGSGAYLSTHTGNTLLGKHADTWTMSLQSTGVLGNSNNNGFYHALRTNHIRAGTEYTLAGWRSASGKDGSSVERVNGDLAGAELFYNDTNSVQTIYLQRRYKDLAGNSVPMVITLQPFTGRILVPDGDPIANLILTKERSCRGGRGRQH